MNELNKIEYKECEHNFVEEYDGEQFTSTIKLRKMRCTKCFAIIYVV